MKFKTLWSGDWPHCSSAGVGLRLEGYPTDESAFVEYLMDQSCHPDASARILERMKVQGGQDSLTVMSMLDFDAIAEKLKTLGVTMTIIAPQPDWVQRFPSGPLPGELCAAAHACCRAMKAHPLLYEGQMVYPLKDLVTLAIGSHLKSCQQCVFDYTKDDSKACAPFGKFINALGINCIGIHWGETQAAQTQYIKERLT